MESDRCKILTLHHKINLWFVLLKKKKNNITNASRHIIMGFKWCWHKLWSPGDYEPVTNGVDFWLVLSTLSTNMNPSLFISVWTFIMFIILCSMLETVEGAFPTDQKLKNVVFLGSELILLIINNVLAWIFFSFFPYNLVSPRIGRTGTSYRFSPSLSKECLWLILILLLFPQFRYFAAYMLITSNLTYIYCGRVRV